MPVKNAPVDKIELEPPEVWAEERPLGRAAFLEYTKPPRWERTKANAQ